MKSNIAIPNVIDNLPFHHPIATDILLSSLQNMNVYLDLCGIDLGFKDLLVTSDGEKIASIRIAAL